MGSYRLLTYDADRARRAGMLIGDTVHDLEDEVAAHAAATGEATGFSGSTVYLAIQAWARSRPVLEAIADNPHTDGAPLSSVKLQAPLPHPGTVYCAAANYYDHAEEMGNPVDKDGLEPLYFLKAPTSIIGPGDPGRRCAVAATVGPENRFAMTES